MILVLFFVITAIIIFLISFCTYIKINCSNLYITNVPEFNYNFSVNIGLYLFNKLKIFSVTINKEKLKHNKMFSKMKVKLGQEKINIPPLKESFKKLSGLNINLEKIDTKIDIGTEDAIITSTVVRSTCIYNWNITWKNYKTL